MQRVSHELLGEDLYRYLGSESVETRFCFDANASTPLGAQRQEKGRRNKSQHEDSIQ